MTFARHNTTPVEIAASSNSFPPPMAVETRTSP